MSTSPVSLANSLTATPPNSTTSAPSSSLGGTPQSQEIQFIQLLVAQLENQDPDQPADGTQFVTELAQFSDLQANAQTSTDLDSILGILQSGAAALNTTGGTGGTNSNNGASGVNQTSN